MTSLSLWQPACFITLRPPGDQGGGGGSHAGGQRTMLPPPPLLPHLSPRRQARAMTERRPLQYTGGFSDRRSFCHFRLSARLCGPSHRSISEEINKEMGRPLVLHMLNFIRIVRHLRTDKTLSPTPRHSLCCQRR